MLAHYIFICNQVNLLEVNIKRNAENPLMDNIINQEVNKADAFCPKSKEDQCFASTAMNYVLQDDLEKLITE